MQLRNSSLQTRLHKWLEYLMFDECELRVRLIYFNVTYRSRDNWPTVDGYGMITCNNPHFTCDFRIRKQPFNHDFKLEVTKATMFGTDAAEKVANRELALSLKRRIKTQIIDLM